MLHDQGLGFYDISYMSKIAIGAWVSKTETYGPLQNITMN